MVPQVWGHWESLCGWPSGWVGGMVINAQWHLCPRVSDCWRLHRGAPRSPAVERAGHPGAAADGTRVSALLHQELGAGSPGQGLGDPPSPSHYCSDSGFSHWASLITIPGFPLATSTLCPGPGAANREGWRPSPSAPTPQLPSCPLSLSTALAAPGW